MQQPLARRQRIDYEPFQCGGVESKLFPSLPGACALPVTVSLLALVRAVGCNLRLYSGILDCNLFHKSSLLFRNTDDATICFRAGKRAAYSHRYSMHCRSGCTLHIAVHRLLVIITSSAN
jgi:hypothetical protein